MKKILIFALLAGIAFTGCKKEKDDPTYTKSQLIGKWKQVTPASETGVTDYVNFTETKVEFISEEGISKTSYTSDYTFDGKAIKYNLIGEVTLTINELNSTTLVVTQTAVILEGSTQYTYTKVQ